MADEIDANCKHTSIEYDVGGLAQPGTNVMLTDIAARLGGLAKAEKSKVPASAGTSRTLCQSVM